MPPRTKQTAGVTGCPNGQVLNPQTGKCIKVNGPTYKKVFGSQAPAHDQSPRPGRGNPGTNYPVQGPCPPGKVVNPITKKCIKRGGPSYKKIFGTAGNAPAAPPHQAPNNAPCPPGKVVNPRTKKCITIGGKAWQEVFGAGPQQPPEPPAVPTTRTPPAPSPARALATINAEKRMYMNRLGLDFDRADKVAKRRILQVGGTYKDLIENARKASPNNVLRLCVVFKAVERKKRFQITHVFIDKYQALQWIEANKNKGTYDYIEFDARAPAAMSRDMKVYIVYYAETNVGSYEHERIVALTFDPAEAESMKSKIVTHVDVMEQPVQFYP